MKRLICVTLTLIAMLLMASCENNPTNCGVHYETRFSVARFAHQACSDESFYSSSQDMCLVEKGGWLTVVKDFGKGSGFVLVRYDRGPHPKNHCKQGACPDKAELLMFKSTFYPYARESKKCFKNHKEVL